jgi:acetylornithine deacetylase/succinyl-diaminopimelate desuccinylase-like protein
LRSHAATGICRVCRAADTVQLIPDHARLTAHVNAEWDGAVLPALFDYIRIPAKSPAFDPQRAEHGELDRAARLMRAWCEQHALPGMTAGLITLPNRTPMLLIEVPGTQPDAGSVLLYGHLDKQPEFTGWT